MNRTTKRGLSEGHNKSWRIHNSGWETDLANAIILQAVDDWKTGVRNPLSKAYHDGGYNFGGNDLGKGVQCEVEKFFRSDWFKLLTDLDGEALIERLEKEFGM